MFSYFSSPVDGRPRRSFGKIVTSSCRQCRFRARHSKRPARPFAGTQRLPCWRCNDMVTGRGTEMGNRCCPVMPNFNGLSPPGTLGLLVVFFPSLISTPQIHDIYGFFKHLTQSHQSQDHSNHSRDIRSWAVHGHWAQVIPYNLPPLSCVRKRRSCRQRCGTLEQQWTLWLQLWTSKNWVIFMTIYNQQSFQDVL